jgi:hypothetical protein
VILARSPGSRSRSDRRRRDGRAAALALGAVAAAALLAAPPAPAQLGPRTMGNSMLSLDAGALGDQIGISSSDSTTHKMELTRELSYMRPDQWQAASVTWLRFRQGENGEVLVTEEGAGVVREVTASKKLRVEAVEGGGWKLVPAKGEAGKLDLYLETVFEGEPFTVGAVVPKFEAEAYGAVYRGVDFLFFVVQKKHPEPAAGAAG